ncbi:YlbF family regulator [Jeotgalibaca sp. MA1X17-3]|uniref:YlbF family regulator n=1 Tax=Jeotgalibaca sp. MA1X17-3 TaxID=2908211 RepID=UPI001F3BB83C|nr:YlbF family regulator [Jeotgalibaca sp. MA1X17-3]UJF15196.1 YlbF family regulator [Jeotgalibaca sp. MA1X17-3]
MSNIYDLAYELEKGLRTQPSFLELTSAYEEVKGNEEAYALFQEFTAMQQELQMKQMSGEGLSEEYIEQAQEIAGRASTNEMIQKMMTAEQQLGTVIEDVNKIIMKPLQDLYTTETTDAE